MTNKEKVLIDKAAELFRLHIATTNNHYYMLTRQILWAENKEVAKFIKSLEMVGTNGLFEQCLSEVNPETRAEVRRNMERVINAKNTMRFIPTTEIAHPPVDKFSGESEYVLTYAGKRLLPIVAQYCTPPFGTGRKKSHWRDTHFKPLVIEPIYWAYIDYPDCPRTNLEAENTEFDYGHNVNHKHNEDNY